MIRGYTHHTGRTSFKLTYGGAHYQVDAEVSYGLTPYRAANRHGPEEPQEVEDPRTVRGDPGA
jgi:hypothetical protein